MKLPDELLPLNQVRQPSEADRLYAQHQAFISNAAAGDPIGIYSYTLAEGIENDMQGKMSKNITEHLQLLQEINNETILTDPDEGIANLEVEDDVAEELVRDLTNPIKFIEQAHAEITKGRPYLSPELAEYEAEQSLYQYVLGATFGKDAVGTVGDFVGMMFYPNESFLRRDIFGGDSWWDSADATRNFAQAWKAQSQEERVLSFFGLVDEVKNSTDNSLKAMILINNIISDDGYGQIAFDDAMDKMGAAGVAVDVASLGMLAIARRGGNAVRVAAKVGNPQHATNLADAALNSDEAAAMMNMNKMDAAVHFTPTNVGDELYVGMPAATRDEVARRQAEMMGRLNQMEEEILEEGIGGMVDQQAAVQRVTKDILSNEAGLAPTNFRVIDADDVGITLQYEAFTPNTYRRIHESDSLLSLPSPATEIKTVTRRYTVDDITGGFKHEVHDHYPQLLRFFASPAHKFKEEAENLVSTMQRGMFQSEKLLHNFHKEYSRIYNIAPQSQRPRVSEALQAGNLEGTVFDYNTLRGRFGMNEKGVQQYHEFRGLMDYAHFAKNQEVVKRSITAGHKLFHLGGKPLQVKPYTSAASAEAAILQSDAHNVLIIGRDSPEPRHMNMRGTADGSVDSRLKEMMDDDYVLLRPQTDGGVVPFNGDNYKMVLVPREEVAEITPYTQLLAYHKGYVPIFYGGKGGDANYIGQVARYGMVDGVERQIGAASRTYFSNSKDAQRWMDENNLRHLTEKYGDPNVAREKLADAQHSGEVLPYSFKHDREFQIAEFDNWSTGGGPYTGHRAEERMTRGVHEDSAEFLDAFAAMSRYMDHIANNVPLASFRVGIEEKWLEHAREVGALRRSYAGGFKDAVEEVKKSSISQDIKDFLYDSHKHVSFNTRVPTLGEREHAGRMVALAEKLEDVWGADNTTSKLLHKLDHVNAPDAIRAATFHTLLGLLSPAQTIVQASGMTVALAANPVYGVRAMPKMLAITTLDTIRNPAARAATLAKLETAYPGITDVYGAWQRTGFFESVISSSADYKSMVRSHPMGLDLYDRAAGTAGQAIDKAAVFYKAGELANRRMSFAVAAERHLAMGGKLNDRGVKDVMNRANTYMLHMDRSNKGDFQKGWMSIPTQFWQVQTKFIEALAGKTLTSREKAQLIATQTAMFGSLGVPMGSPMLNYVLDKMDTGPETEEMQKFMNDGAVGLILSEVMGMNIEVATRVAIPHGITGTIEDLFWSDKGFWEAIGGAATSIPSRIIEAGKGFNDVFDGADWDVTQLDGDDYRMLVEDMLGVVSSGRSAVAAFQMWNQSTIYNRRGVPILDTSDLTTREIIARGAGFQLTEMTDIYRHMNGARQMREREREYTDRISKYLSRRWAAGDMSEDEARRTENVVRHMLSSESPEMQRRVKESVFRRITDGETLQDRIMKETLERWINDLMHWTESTRQPIPMSEGE